MTDEEEDDDEQVDEPSMSDVTMHMNWAWPQTRRNAAGRLQSRTNISNVRSRRLFRLPEEVTEDSLVADDAVTEWRQRDYEMALREIALMVGHVERGEFFSQTPVPDFSDDEEDLPELYEFELVPGWEDKLEPWELAALLPDDSEVKKLKEGESQ